MILFGLVRKYIDIYFEIFFMDCADHCAYRIFWSGGLLSLKIRVILWKMVVPLQAEIILRCFKTVCI